MTPSVLEFLKKAPAAGTVLEVGSYNVNGSARDAIAHEKWVGTDMREGPGVDVVLKGETLSQAFEGMLFDCVVCAETLEHCERWREVVLEMWKCLKPDGVLCITTPAPGFPKHDFPNDFWRFTEDNWKAMFKEQEILATATWIEWGPGSGVILRKKQELWSLASVFPAVVKQKVMIATPFYERKGFSPYIVSLLNTVQVLNHYRIEYDFVELSGDAYVDRAKNTLCNSFLDSDCTDLVIIDSDLEWDAIGFLRLLAAPADVVGGLYPLKSDPVFFPAAIHLDEAGKIPACDLPGLIAADWIPGGFTRYSRGCLMQMAAAYRHRQYRDPSAMPGQPERWYVPFFECVVENGQRFGEDVEFFRKWKAIGGKTYIEPRVQFGHYGSKGWHGNFQSHLEKLDLIHKEPK